MKTISIVIIAVAAIALFSLNTLKAGSAYKERAKVHIAKVAQTKAEMPASKHIETIVLGAGCFWGAEKRYQAIPGVIDAVSGYAGGHGVKPDYQEIIKRSNKNNPKNHAEVVRVTFNNAQIGLEAILQNYFEGHDPTQVNRQGNDRGTQYRSTILTNNQQQVQLANKVLAQYQTLLSAKGYGKIATIVKPLQTFFPAEDYHQDYLAKNPNGYCPDHSTGVKFDSSDNQALVDNSALRKGKQIVVIEAEGYCPYCEKFKENVLNDYQGTIGVSFRLASQLNDLDIKTETWATPTILFLQEGREVFGRQGYMTPNEFYEALGLFKLGKSEAYNVAFNEGTDSRFCKQYDIFKNTPEGLFVDKLSGKPLFDTRDRFDSGTGWLSFTKAVDGSVTEREDNRYGIRRIEIRSKSSGIHLGHVFPDGPNGKSRYCINATVLDFKPST